jgi:hypothetical protein
MIFLLLYEENITIGEKKKMAELFKRKYYNIKIFLSWFCQFKLILDNAAKLNLSLIKYS